MNDASRYMAENGILLAYLQGISEFYHRFGYYPYTATSRVKFSEEAAAKIALPGRLRRMTVKDLPAVRKLYDQATTRRVCVAARDDRVWRWLLTNGRKTWLFSNPRVAVAADGKLCGYVTGTDSHRNVKLREVVTADDTASVRVVLGALCRLARERNTDDISVPLPWDDPLTVCLRQRVDCEFTADSRSAGGSLMKIVDVAGLMRTLEPMFCERLAAHGRWPRKQSFVLIVDDERIRFTASECVIRVGGGGRRGSRVVVPRRLLSGLLTGYYQLQDVLGQEDVRVPAATVSLLRVLFPPNWPFIYQGDNY